MTPYVGMNCCNIMLLSLITRALMKKDDNTYLLRQVNQVLVFGVESQEK